MDEQIQQMIKDMRNILVKYEEVYAADNEGKTVEEIIISYNDVIFNDSDGNTVGKYSSTKWIEIDDLDCYKFGNVVRFRLDIYQTDPVQLKRIILYLLLNDYEVKKQPKIDNDFVMVKKE